MGQALRASDQRCVGVAADGRAAKVRRRTEETSTSSLTRGGTSTADSNERANHRARHGPVVAEGKHVLVLTPFRMQVQHGTLRRSFEEMLELGVKAHQKFFQNKVNIY